MAAEVVASTVVAASAVVAAILVVAELDRVSVGAHVLAAPAVFAVVHLAPMVRTEEAGREPTAIDLTVRGPMGCTVEEARLHLVHVAARCRGTELIRG